MITNSFSPDIADQVGMTAACLYKTIEQCLEDPDMQHDGQPWTQQSVKALELFLPYLSGKTIQRAVGKLADNGLIVTAKYLNGDRMDHSIWFTTGAAK